MGRGRPHTSTPDGVPPASSRSRSRVQHWQHRAAGTAHALHRPDVRFVRIDACQRLRSITFSSVAAQMDRSTSSLFRQNSNHSTDVPGGPVSPSRAPWEPHAFGLFAQEAPNVGLDRHSCHRLPGLRSGGSSLRCCVGRSESCPEEVSLGCCVTVAVAGHIHVRRRASASEYWSYAGLGVQDARGRWRSHRGCFCHPPPISPFRPLSAQPASGPGLSAHVFLDRRRGFLELWAPLVL